MLTTLNDLRYGLRDLLASRTFAMAAILSIALGIAANAIIFSLVSAVLLRPLPVPRPEGLVRIGGSIHGRGHMTLSVTDHREIATAPALAGVAAHRFNQIVMNVDHQPRVAGVEIVSDNYFEVLEVRPARGRTFGGNDREPGSPVDLTPENGSGCNLTIWVKNGRSECRVRGTAPSRSYASSGRLRWSWLEGRRSRMPAAS